MKKGICLLLCIILLACLPAPGALAANGPGTADGVYASICLTGGTDKCIYSADSEIERKILSPDESTEARYLPLEGVSYDAQSNTLCLSDFSDPGATLLLTMMGGDFTIRLSGNNALAAIRSESMGYGGSISFTGDGALDVTNLGGCAIIVNAGGAADFVRVEPQVRLSLTGTDGAISVAGTSFGEGAISFDTASPNVRAEDGAQPLPAQMTSAGVEVEVCTRAGEEGLFGLFARIDDVTDPENPTIVHDVYLLGQKDEAGIYGAELIEEGLADISAYSPVYTPHEWSLYDVSTGAPVSQVRLARFAVSVRSNDENGSVSVSQTAVGRGGSVVVTALPNEGYKLASLTVNGVEVTSANGSYTIGGIVADQSVEASFAASVPAAIVLTAPASTAFTVPGSGEADFVSEPFTALVTDGSGDPVGAAIDWSVEPALDGVSIRSDGCIVVSPAVKSAAEEGTLSFAVTARVRDTELSDSTGSFTVCLAERRAAGLFLTREGQRLDGSDSVTIPESGSVAVPYGAVLLDQYGEALDGEIAWVAGDWPAGVSRQDSTLTVTSEAQDGSTLSVTASAASDSAVCATVTVSFSKPEEEKKETPPLPDEGEPGQNRDGATELTVTWPTVTLAEDPVYGIAWSELVTLGEDGAAVRGEETVEGTFTVKAENEFPNCSDSFTILFTYTDGEETKTAESEAHAVTLSPKALSADMITLTPAEMPYTGAACEPAVSLKDGARALEADVDYTVSGYADNTAVGTGSVTVEGKGNYTGSAAKSFAITAIPGSAVTDFVTSRKPEDEGTEPTVELKNGDTTLKKGQDYDVSFQYDIPSKSGTATITLKGAYSGTIVSRFDLPNYLITAGAGGSWNKGSASEMSFTANGALGKFTELTVDGKTVDPSYYTTESGSTIVKLKPNYLKSLSAGKHIIGVAYRDGKALAIFSVTDISRRGVATGDENDLQLWIMILGVSVIAIAVLCVALALSGRKKKKKRKKKSARK